MASAEMVRKTLGHWISIGNYTNSKVFLSQSHWPRCENNSFQSLLNIDQSDQLEYVHKCCLGPIAQESEHSFSLAFCSVSAVRISPHHIVRSVSRSLATMFHRVQLRLERFYTISFWSLAHLPLFFTPFPVDTLQRFLPCDKHDLTVKRVFVSILL